MQETRRRILDILKQRKQATVDDIVIQLRSHDEKHITAVTVRHHLGVLFEEGYVTEPELRHRNTPGRPQNVYMLTEKAHGLFPNNYSRLVTALMGQIEKHLPPNGINVVFEGVAAEMAAEMGDDGSLDGLSYEQRLDMVVGYLNERGYEADWETGQDGYMLHTRNCPYHAVAQTTDTLCTMDMRLITSLVGVVPRRIARLSSGDEACTYLFPHVVSG